MGMGAGDRLTQVQDAIRFVVGAVILGLVATFTIGSPAGILADLNGMTGLGLIVGIGVVTPRRYLRNYFHIASLYFFAMALWWLLAPAKSPIYWMAFGTASVLMAVCAYEIGRRERQKETPA